MSCVAEGDSVVLVVNGDKRYVTRVKAGSRVKLGQTRCTLDALVGCPYGTLFTLASDGASLEQAPHMPSEEWELATTETAKNNASLIDDNANQQLGSESIQEMRAAGASGGEIVAALAAASSTFESKTEFAQEKYKKKKAKKHSLAVAVQRASAAAVCEVYYGTNPARIGFLRLDALALLLSLANVGAHARVVLVESSGGLVTAAVAERLGSHGSVASAWLGPKPGSQEVWRQCAVSAAPAAAATVQFLPLAQLLAETEGPAAQAPATEQQQLQQLQQQHHEQEQLPTEAGGASQQQQAERQQQEAAPPPAPMFDSCIVCCPRVSPIALLRRLLPLLAPSASFVVHSSYAQPLAEALAELRSGGLAVNLALQEAWWREQQVLPARTHPLMGMDHGGGLLLSGTVAAAAPLPGAAADTRKRQRE